MKNKVTWIALKEQMISDILHTPHELHCTPSSNPSNSSFPHCSAYKQCLQ